MGTRNYQWSGDGLLTTMYDTGNDPFGATYEYDHTGTRWFRSAVSGDTWYLG